MRDLCLYAGTHTGTGHERVCNHPGRGGTCRKLVECQSCELWTGRNGPEQPSAPSTPTRSRIELPCIHMGDPVPPPDRTPTTKTYIRCEAGKGTICRCSCNSGCDRYEPDTGSV